MDSLLAFFPLECFADDVGAGLVDAMNASSDGRFVALTAPITIFFLARLSMAPQ
jgi:hypothetical protein